QPEALAIQTDLEALQAIRDEIKQNQEGHPQSHSETSEIVASDNDMPLQQTSLLVESELAIHSETISETLTEALDHLETVSATINADLLHYEAVPFERIGTDVDSDIIQEDIQEVAIEVLAHTEDPLHTEESLHNELSSPEPAFIETTTTVAEPIDTDEIIRTVLYQNNVPTERQLQAKKIEQTPSLENKLSSSTPVEPDPEKSQEEPMQRQNKRLVGRPGDFIFYA
ncbi:MAG: hypothetical protein ACO3XO_05455, partial [Bdellovibrionota bacterium]